MHGPESDLVKLYEYQEQGRDFLASRRRAYLADVPGLGKTAQALTAADRIDAKTIVVVCPAAAIPVWEAEAKTWWPAHMGRGLTVISYARLARLADHTKLADAYGQIDLVILDEAHYTKSPGAKRTKAALKLAAAADRAWLLSGSPMPNNPWELWTVFHYLWPEFMPPEAATNHDWLSHFCKWFSTDYGPRVTGTRNAEQLSSMLRNFMLRRRVQDVGLQLPPLRLSVVPLPADRRFAEELEAHRDDYETATVRRLLGAHKAERIAKLVGDEQLSPVVLMYHHKDTGEVLRTHLRRRGWRCYGFDGSTPAHGRGRQVELFQAETKGPTAFIVQQQAGGVAITLTSACEIVLVEPDWSPEVNAQAIKRVHRISQDRPVRARIFAVDESLDGAIMRLLAEKIQMRKEIL